MHREWRTTPGPYPGRQRSGIEAASPDGRGPWMRRSPSAIATSLMDASRRRIRPCSSNSQFSLPYERHQRPSAVVPLVLEAHRDAVAAERPEVLAQDVVELALPLARQERVDLVAPAQELVAVAPLRVLAVREHDAVGIARVPRVLGGLHLLARRLLGEGRERRARHGGGRHRAESSARPC